MIVHQPPLQQHTVHVAQLSHLEAHLKFVTSMDARQKTRG